MTSQDKTRTAKKIIARLAEVSQFAADDAKLWENHGKCRIYFGRKYIEIFDDGSCDVGSNPYSLSTIVADYCRIR